MPFNKSILDEKSDIFGHLEFMYDKCKNINAKKILEIGVRTGESTKALIQVVEENNGILYSIDVCDCSKVINSNNWIFIKSDSKYINILDQFLLKEIDVLFIDSSHTYDGTLFELQNYSRLVRVGGIIFLHDNYIKAIEDAIQEFLKDNNKFIYTKRDGWNGFGVLERIK